MESCSSRCGHSVNLDIFLFIQVIEFGSSDFWFLYYNECKNFRFEKNIIDIP